jgi:hypothetical protein
MKFRLVNNSAIYLIMLLCISLSIIMFQGCSSSEDKSGTDSETSAESGNLMKDAEEMEDDGLGFGPVKSVSLTETVDEGLAAEGMKHFEAKCTACHKFSHDKYVGPGLLDITKRRKPEWIMNMILNPQEMTQRDPVAKELFATYLTQMTNQNVTEPEARSILEYFRKMDATGASN